MNCKVKHKVWNAAHASPRFCIYTYTRINRILQKITKQGTDQARIAYANNNSQKGGKISLQTKDVE